MKKLSVALLIMILFTGIVFTIPANAAVVDGTVLFSENFDSVSSIGDLKDWNFTRGKDITQAEISDGKLILTNSGDFSKTESRADELATYYKFMDIPKDVTSFTYECDITILQGADKQFAGIGFHINDDKNFTNVIIRLSDIFGVSRFENDAYISGGSNGAKVTELGLPAPSLNTTYKFKIESTSDKITFYLNDIDTSDVSAAPINLAGQGGALALFQSAGTKIAFDNVLVYAGAGVEPIYIKEESKAESEKISEVNTDAVVVNAAQTFDIVNIGMITLTVSGFAIAISKKR